MYGSPRDHLTRASWTLADQAVVSLGNFLLNIQLARHLPVSDYGVYALLFSGIFLFQHCCVAMLLYPMSLKIVNEDQQRGARFVSVTMAMLAACQLAFSTVLAAIMLAAGRPDVALAIAIFSLLWQMQDALRRSLMANFRHREAIIGDAATYIGQAVAVGLMLKWGQVTLVGALFTMAVASAIGGLVQWRQLGLALPDLSLAPSLAKEFWRTGRWAVLSGVLMHSRLQIFPWLLGLLHGPAAAAAFQAVLNIANLTNPVLFGLSNSISQAAAQTWAGGGNQAAWRAARFYMLAGAPFIMVYCLGVFAAPGLVLKLFYGASSAYLDNELAVRLIMLAVAINYLAECYNAFLYGVDQGRLASLIALVGLTVALVASGMILPWAVAGAVGAMLAANLARFLASIVWTKSALHATRPPVRADGAG